MSLACLAGGNYGKRFTLIKWVLNTTICWFNQTISIFFYSLPEKVRVMTLALCPPRVDKGST
jgi:hypothetical protein